MLPLKVFPTKTNKQKKKKLVKEKSCKHEEMNFPHFYIILFYPVFNWGDISQKCELEKYKTGLAVCWGLSIEEGVKTVSTL